MVELDTEVLGWLTAAGSIGAALAGVKLMVTGVREDMSDAKQKLAEHVKEDHEVQTKILTELATIRAETLFIKEVLVEKHRD